jgi:hypothetical protein
MFWSLADILIEFSKVLLRLFFVKVLFYLDLAEMPIMLANSSLGKSCLGSWLTSNKSSAF